MSSPLSLLKKTKRAPLPGHNSDRWVGEKVPFRRDRLKEFQSEVVNSDDDDDPCGAAAVAGPSKSKSPRKKVSPPSDFELMSAMMQRINLLEKRVMSQEQELERKDKQISRLEEKLRMHKESAVTHHPSDRDDVDRKCQQLQNQVCEMERFLNDYGLIWVGDERSSDPDLCEQPHGSGAGLWKPDTSVVRDFHVDFDLVLQRIRNLNILTGEGESVVQSTSTGAQLAQKNPVQLSLYRNGMVLFDGPFRSYAEPSIQQFIQDLIDGYFPSELQEIFPDGIPFEVHDKRDEEFVFRSPRDRFPGEGQTVCGVKGESSRVGGCEATAPPHRRGSEKECRKKGRGKKVTVDQFLNRIPKVVIKAGQVIDVRASLRDSLQGLSDDQNADSAILIDTAALQTVNERLQTSASPYDIITLKVRSEDGSQTYVLKMCRSETIGQLRQYLDKHRGGGGGGYDVMSTFPRRRYDDDRRTLQSCGLTTNATLLLRKSQRCLPLTAVK